MLLMIYTLWLISYGMRHITIIRTVETALSWVGRDQNYAELTYTHAGIQRVTSDTREMELHSSIRVVASIEILGLK